MKRIPPKTPLQDPVVPPIPSRAQDWKLLPGEVVVWHLRLDPDPGTVAACASVLADDERNRARSFAFDRDRRRFTVARGVLRILLGRYLRQPPAAVRFRYNSFGKPALDPAFGPATVQFNVAHSADLALLAFSAERELGVDLEAIRPDPAPASSVGRFFSPGEQAELARVDPALRTLAFFLCWTRKEAFIKAVGKGLSLPLDSFDVSLTPGEPALLRAVRSEISRSAWSFADLDLLPGYAAAVVGAGAPFTVRYRRWPTAI